MASGWYSDQNYPKVQCLQSEHVSKSQECWFFRNKSPAGSFETSRICSESEQENMSFQGSSQGYFFKKLTSTKYMHVPDDIEKCSFSRLVFTDQNNFLLKIKRVRMGHRNLFYKTDWEIWDGNRHLWRKSNILEGGTWEFRIQVQIWTFEGCFQVEMMFENSLEVPALIPAQFQYKMLLS